MQDVFNSLNNITIDKIFFFLYTFKNLFTKRRNMKNVHKFSTEIEIVNKSYFDEIGRRYKETKISITLNIFKASTLFLIIFFVYKYLI